MELVIEAISDLKSACTDRQPHTVMCSCRDPQTDLESDLAAGGHIWLLRWELIYDVNLRLRVWSLSVKTSCTVSDCLSAVSVALCAGSEALSWSQNSLWMTSALKEPYSNPWAALADYPASILQRIHLMLLFPWHVCVSVCEWMDVCESVFEDGVMTECECAHVLVFLDSCMRLSLPV